MSVPVIGQIRSLQDAQRALENIRSWFMTYTGQQVSTETVNTIVQRTITSTANNNALLKSANLSDVASPTLAFDRIKQAATPSYAGVMRFAQSIEAINGEATDCAVTPAGVKAHVDSIVANEFAVIVYESGTTLYVCKADVGAAEEDSVWQIKKVDAADPENIIVTWADGNALFDNVATDLATVEAISYS